MTARLMPGQPAATATLFPNFHCHQKSRSRGRDREEEEEQIILAKPKLEVSSEPRSLSDFLKVMRAKGITEINPLDLENS